MSCCSPAAPGSRRSRRFSRTCRAATTHSVTLAYGARTSALLIYRDVVERCAGRLPSLDVSYFVEHAGDGDPPAVNRGPGLGRRDLAAPRAARSRRDTTSRVRRRCCGASARTCAHATSLRRPFTLTPGNSESAVHRRSGGTGPSSSRARPASSGRGWCGSSSRPARTSSPGARLGAALGARRRRHDRTESGSCAATSAIRRRSSARSASTRSRPSSTWRPRRRSASPTGIRSRRSTRTSAAPGRCSRRAGAARPSSRSSSHRPTRRTATRTCSRTRRTRRCSGGIPYDVSKSCADLIAQMYAKTLRPAGVRHALRQLLRRRRSQLEPHRARHDSLGPPRRAAGHSLRRAASRATTSTSRTARGPTCCWPSRLAARPALARRGLQLLLRAAG